MGKVWNTTLDSGMHFTAPAAKISSFTTKTRLLVQTNHVPTKEGLNVQLDVSVLYHIDPENALDIFLGLGPEYEDIVIVPQLSSAVRGRTSAHEAKDLYGEGRNDLQQELNEQLKAVLAPRHIIVEDVLLNSVGLPAQLTASIEAKTQAEQESQRMTFVLAKERQEAERKAIEAGGIAEFQRIVSEGISEQLLRWKGIEATERLASSPNAKTIFVGNSLSSLPVLLSGAS